MALTEKLTAIGDAIRAKTGGSEKLTLDQMPTEIEGIQTGGGGGIEVEPIVLTGSQSYGWAGVLSSQYIKMFGNTITTNKITDGSYMFKNSQTESIPFEINFDNTLNADINDMFYGCEKLKTIPKTNNVKPYSMNNLFYRCHSIREIPNDWFDNWDFSTLSGMTSSYLGNCSSLFAVCYSLRKTPLSMFRNMNPNIVYSYSYLYSGFNNCYVIDETVDLPLPFISTWTSNAFNNTFTNCRRIKKITFETNEDGTPKVMKWKGQIIDLTKNVGHFETSISQDPELWDTGSWLGNSINYSEITDYNSGITEDKAVYTTSTYQALKNDPDAFFISSNYYRDRYYFSRYNHDSAVETINSLPDTSAYLATAGGTNTIKFKGVAGLGTDGGAINTMTEEEIAVATAKGWTVSFV